MKTPSGSDHCPRAPNRSGCYEPFRFDNDFAPHFKIQSAAVAPINIVIFKIVKIKWPKSEEKINFGGRWD